MAQSKIEYYMEMRERYERLTATLKLIHSFSLAVVAQDVELDSTDQFILRTHLNNAVTALRPQIEAELQKSMDQHLLEYKRVAARDVRELMAFAESDIDTSDPTRSIDT